MVKEKMIYFKETKTGKFGSIPIRDDLFKTFKLRNNHNHFLLNKPSNPEKKLIGNTIYKRLTKYNISAHSLRKTFGYDLYQKALNSGNNNAAVALETLMAIYNHNSISITLKYIGHEQKIKDDLIGSISYL